MERKTIGSFIAVLRKARGLTQRQLAEKLNVSDKTVSRLGEGRGISRLGADTYTGRDIFRQLRRASERGAPARGEVGTGQGKGRSAQ